jgi:tetratricopeptide (TPR) repeat protein
MLFDTWPRLYLRAQREDWKRNSMRWQQTEFVFKGIYLGLVLFVGLALREPEWWRDIAQVALCTFGTLSVFLGATAYRKLRDGEGQRCKINGRYGAFVVYLLLENPGMVYTGVVLGMLLGASSLASDVGLFGQAVGRDEEAEGMRLFYCVAGGAVLGLAFDFLNHLHSAPLRRWLGLAAAGGLIGASIFSLPGAVPSGESRVMLATLLLLSMPLFYLLTLAGLTEESEVEIMAVCAALGISLWILADRWLTGNVNIQLATLLVPTAIYLLYTRFVLPGLRVFKCVLRGMSYANVGQMRLALLSFGRALQLDPGNALARQQMWRLHRRIDVHDLAGDPVTAGLIDCELCLERVAMLLLPAKPTPDQLQEVYRLLDLVCEQRPQMKPRCDYWRAVALTHESQFTEAAEALRRVLVGEGETSDSPHRRAILFPAWQLATSLHPEMTARVGEPQLAISGQRMHAIAAVEQKLAAEPENADAWDLKRLFYSELTEQEYHTQVVGGVPPAHFDHAYVHQLGLALVGDADRWRRGCEFLRIAALGLPRQGPTIYLAMAGAYGKAAEFADVWACYEQAKLIGQRVGPKELSAEDRNAYFAILKTLGDDASKRGDVDAALDCYRLFAEYERAGMQTYRTLADLYERKGDAWSALHATEQGLVYDSKDSDFLARKDRYYFSVAPEEVRQRREQIQTWFDRQYCLQKSRWLLDHLGENLELLDWASHLAELAQILDPASLAAKVLRARVLRRRGENDQAIVLLEEVRGNKPEKFATSEDEEAWFLSCRLLGDLYLNSKPDQAVACYQEYRKHGKSGADTVYKMGLAFENMGELQRARKCFETVAAYEDHPLAPEARGALSRLQTSV